MNKKGKIIPNGVCLEKHENEIAIIFTELGLDVELIPPSYAKGRRTADAIIAGLEWEFKSPRGKSERTLQRIIKKATHQAQNIVIDIRHTPIKQEKCIALIGREFRLKHSIKRLKIIDKSGKVIDFSR